MPDATDIERQAELLGWPMTPGRAASVAQAAGPTLALLRQAAAMLPFDQGDDFRQALQDCRQEPVR